MQSTMLGEWNGNRIRVNPADSDYINATDMCKANGKLVADWLRLKSSKEYIAERSLTMGIPIVSLVLTTEGRTGETWIHRKLAITLARWCSVQFAIWCDDRIEDLMKTGKVAVHREHQEAQLVNTQVGAILLETLGEVKKQGQLLERGLEACDQSNRNYQLTLQSLNSKKPRQLEAVVQSQLVAEEGGVREYTLPNGAKVDVVIADQWIVECKYWKDYKSAIGQIKVYDLFSANFDLEPRIHLFSRPGEPGPTDKSVRQIERECRLLGIAVTWHQWKLSPPKMHQPMLALPY